MEDSPQTRLRAAGAPAEALDAILHDDEGVVVGAFRCPTTDSRFRDSGPIQNDILVFPRSSVRIRHAGGPSFVADHTVATVYNRGQVYERRAVAEDGDRSDWFAVPRVAACEAMIANGLEPGPHGPFSFPFAPVSDEIYLSQRRLFRRVQRGMAAHAIEEEVFALLDDVAAAGASRRRWAGPSGAGSPEIAEEVRALLSARFDEEWPLSRLASRFGMSTFRLCRAFRKATASTIHRYLLTLRLRSSLERLERPGVEITSVALDLGFSSHSHFSLTFGRNFRETPSTYRETLAG